MVTDASGNYGLTGLGNGNYTLTPSLAGFVFTPATADVTINAASVAGRNFAGAQSVTTFGISGTVSNQAGAPLAGVAISLSGAANRTVATNASGNYSITGLANGNYTLTPTLAGISFTPSSRSVTIVGGNAPAQNFVGTQPGLGFQRKIFMPLITKGPQAGF